MLWAQRLKRVFGIEIEACARCGSASRGARRVRTIARLPTA